MFSGETERDVFGFIKYIVIIDGNHDYSWMMGELDNGLIEPPGDDWIDIIKVISDGKVFLKVRNDIWLFEFNGRLNEF